MITSFRKVVSNFYRHLDECSAYEKVALAIFFSFLTAVSAKIRIPLPFTPVPITGQTFAVLLSGFILGEYGALSQIIYLSLGVSGVPWFAFGGGPGYVFSPTFGYILGFIFSAYFLGKYFKKKNPKFWEIFLVFCLANFVIIYGVGLAWLWSYFKLLGHQIGILKLLEIGAFPFVPGDLIKIFAATSIAYSIRRRRFRCSWCL